MVFYSVKIQVIKKKKIKYYEKKYIFKTYNIDRVSLQLTFCN